VLGQSKDNQVLLRVNSIELIYQLHNVFLHIVCSRVTFEMFNHSFAKFCFKESYDDNEDLNTTLYLCRLIMSFLCLLYGPPTFAYAVCLTVVCCSYLKRAFKTSTDLYSTLKQSRSTKRDLRRRGLFRFGSSIGIACLIDSCAELFMESFCLLINLWMVFGANNPIDMVLNSLAIEFIKDIGVLLRCDRDDCLTRPSDNEFCSFFMYSSCLLALSKYFCFVYFDFIATMLSCFTRAQMA
jgi:hypothetical protein